MRTHVLLSGNHAAIAKWRADNSRVADKNKTHLDDGSFVRARTRNHFHRGVPKVAGRHKEVVGELNVCYQE